jgi:hypothetical protein
LLSQAQDAELWSWAAAASGASAACWWGEHGKALGLPVCLRIQRRRVGWARRPSVPGLAEPP